MGALRKRRPLRPPPAPSRRGAVSATGRTGHPTKGSTRCCRHAAFAATGSSTTRLGSSTWPAGARRAAARSDPPSSGAGFIQSGSSSRWRGNIRSSRRGTAREQV
eukprot:6788278-Prymnesium_polylepis.1